MDFHDTPSTLSDCIHCIHNEAETCVDEIYDKILSDLEIQQTELRQSLKKWRKKQLNECQSIEKSMINNKNNNSPVENIKSIIRDEKLNINYDAMLNINDDIKYKQHEISQLIYTHISNNIQSILNDKKHNNILINTLLATITNSNINNNSDQDCSNSVITQTQLKAHNNINDYDYNNKISSLIKSSEFKNVRLFYFDNNEWNNIGNCKGNINIYYNNSNVKYIVFKNKDKILSFQEININESKFSQKDKKCINWTGSDWCLNGKYYPFVARFKGGKEADFYNSLMKDISFIQALALVPFNNGNMVQQSAVNDDDESSTQPQTPIPVNNSNIAQQSTVNDDDDKQNVMIDDNDDITHTDGPPSPNPIDIQNDIHDDDDGNTQNVMNVDYADYDDDDNDVIGDMFHPSVISPSYSDSKTPRKQSFNLNQNQSNINQYDDDWKGTLTPSQSMDSTTSTESSKSIQTINKDIIADAMNKEIPVRRAAYWNQKNKKWMKFGKKTTIKVFKAANNKMMVQLKDRNDKQLFNHEIPKAFENDNQTKCYRWSTTDPLLSTSSDPAISISISFKIQEYYQAFGDLVKKCNNTA